MNARPCLIVAAVLGLSAPQTEGRDPHPLREARSEGGRYHLRVDAGRGESGRCRAALFESAGEAKRGRLVWRAKLVNEVAPGRVLIRDDGRFVVTLDEFRRGGAAHAVVIYDERGELLREFGVDLDRLSSKIQKLVAKQEGQLRLKAAGHRYDEMKKLFHELNQVP